MASGMNSMKTPAMGSRSMDKNEDSTRADDSKKKVVNKTLNNLASKNKVDAKAGQEKVDSLPPLLYENNPLRNFAKAKFASKTHGLITSYSANTHNGIQRNYNEDRVSIILNMT